MSEKHADNNIKITSKCLAEGNTMGNLFSKENPEDEDLPKKAVPDEETRSNTSCIPPNLLLQGEDNFLKFFDQGGTSNECLLSEANESEVLDSEKVILNAFLNEVRNAKPAPLKNWSSLQHYVYFIYRHVISEKPCNSSEIFPNVITKKIRDLVRNLLQEDVTQLCIRLVTLVREYAIIARGHFNCLQHPKITAYLVSLMSYYSAFCSAASKLAPLLPEFDFLIMERFNVNWLCLNKSIFYHYVYLSPAVQAKIPIFLKLKEENKAVHKNLLESYSCFSEDMVLIANRWSSLRIRISSLSRKRALSNPSKNLITDWSVFEEQKKILKTNYWMVRNTQAMQLQEMAELDGHLLSLVGDTAYIADFLIDSQGHCMCEDCLAAEFRSSSMSTVIPSPFPAHSSVVCRLITCYICQDPIALDSLASHIVTKHNDSQSQKTARVYLTPHQKRIPKKLLKSDSGKARELFPFEGLLEKNMELKESLLKLVNGRIARNNAAAMRDVQEISNNINENLCFQPELVFHSSSKTVSAASMFSLPKDSDELKRKPSGSSRLAQAAFPLKPTVSPVFQIPAESSFKTTKEPIFKIASEAPIMKNGSEVMFKAASKSNENEQPAKVVFDEFLKQEETNDSQSAKNLLPDGFKWKTDKASGSVLLKGAEFFSKKDVFEESHDKRPNLLSLSTSNTFVNSATVENTAFRKPHQKGITMTNMDQKMLEFLKNANTNSTQKTSPTAAAKTSDSSCSGHACGHKCKQEDDKQSDSKKQSCQDTCEHHKESRKCDCAYCEVFGATLPSHSHKTNETRDRLRSRLNQRKEKVTDNVNKVKAPLEAKLPSKNNGNVNCTIKITGSSKISMSNGRATNVNMASNVKVNVKPAPSEPDTRGPPRVPEVIHPVPPAASTKPVIAATEIKKAAIPPNTQLGISSTTVPSKDVPSSHSNVEQDIINSSERRPSSSLSSSTSLNSDNVDCRDINELLNYIEGNKNIDKAALAQKKAAKKARQRVKKAEEREKIEKQKRLKEEARLKEEKIKEAARLKAEAALARQLADKQRKSNKKALMEENRIQKQEAKKNSKRKGKNNSESNSGKQQEKQSNLIEETIPAMVTIKRVAEGSNSPATVTITLKGSTPESDKLLFTLVNGHNNTEQVATATINADSKTSKTKSDPPTKCNSQSHANKTNDNQKNGKKKKKKEVDEVVSKELKVTIAVDKNNVEKKTAQTKKNIKSNEVSKVPETKASEKYSQSKPVDSNVARDDINLPMLRLPPGITITKIEGPPNIRNCRSSTNTLNTQSSQNPNVPVSKSGVIVVDTEKLIQQSITASNNKKNKKKNKKKRDQRPATEAEGLPNKNVPGKVGSSMVTLKNPIFHTLQTSINSKTSETTDPSIYSNNQQASIFKNENGMVTIRSPRLQNSFENGSSISNFISDLKPMFGPDITSAPYMPMCHSSFPEGTKNTPFNAHEILSGLPGIEITKVDKSLPKTEPDHKKASQPAEVSIIPTGNNSNNAEKFNFDRDDWPFESVFTPRDVLEEDMDAEERELEAFKRFCQQSIPPERKEKVAHLNVKDIILNKKRDVTYS